MSIWAGGLDAVGLGVFAATIVAAAVLRAFSGFGFALAAMPLLVLVIEPVHAVVLCGFLSVAGGLRSARNSMAHCDRGLLKPLLIGSLIGTPIGIALLDHLPADTMKFLIGFGVLGSAVLLWRTGIMEGVRRLYALPVGFSAGLLGGALAIPGPPIIVFLLGTERDPKRARATLMAFFTLTSLLSIAGYVVAGLVDGTSLVLFVWALPCLLLGDWIGFGLFERHGSAHYRRVALFVLAAIGVGAVINALR
ncbi:sulfite exporter TauE/SafE family protein [Oleomonas cavernae]|uniref:sulfite exporter TauE/SafE family protein n=1 Tax=Oleomonas cavernae TaxID=2320859 RepID=UPI001314A48C|nr:sulfite exporter TauE/SafE family protein [Oleomonas cavernae]